MGHERTTARVGGRRDTSSQLSVRSGQQRQGFQNSTSTTAHPASRRQEASRQGSTDSRAAHEHRSTSTAEGVKQKMAAQILAGSVAVGVVPSAVGFAEKLRAAIVPESAKVGEQAAQVITDAIRAKLEEFKGSVAVEANTGPATASIDRLRAETEKPAVMPVKVETTGGGGKGALGSKEALAAEGAAGGEALAGGFSKKTKEGFNKVGKDAAKGIAGIAIGSVYEGIKLQHSADVLTAAEKTKGIAIAANKPRSEEHTSELQSLR